MGEIRVWYSVLNGFWDERIGKIKSLCSLCEEFYGIESKMVLDYRKNFVGLLLSSGDLEKISGAGKDIMASEARYGLLPDEFNCSEDLSESLAGLCSG